MASHQSKHGYLTSAQLEFLSEDEPITIIPNFNLDTVLELASDSYGPFEPNFPLEVPLWLAINLKKRHQCNIQAPSWMDVESLTDILKQEKSNASDFSLLPFYYMEISTQLLRIARDDIPMATEVHNVLDEIWYVRNAKIRTMLSQQPFPVAVLRIKNLGSMEINAIRSYVQQVAEVSRHLDAPLESLTSSSAMSAHSLTPHTPHTLRTPATSSSSSSSASSFSSNASPANGSESIILPVRRRQLRK